MPGIEKLGPSNDWLHSKCEDTFSWAAFTLHLFFLLKQFLLETSVDSDHPNPFPLFSRNNTSLPLENHLCPAPHCFAAALRHHIASQPSLSSATGESHNPNHSEGLSNYIAQLLPTAAFLQVLKLVASYSRSFSSDDSNLALIVVLPSAPTTTWQSLSGAEESWFLIPSPSFLPILFLYCASYPWSFTLSSLTANLYKMLIFKITDCPK